MNAIIIFLTLALSEVQIAKYSDYAPIIDAAIVYENQQLDKQAMFYGGDKECFSYITNAIKSNKALRKASIDGTVYVKFMVNTDGTVCNVEMIKGLNNTVDQECLKLISSMPKWRPGTLDFENVSTSIILPIIFGNTETAN
jgi:TonB family protein